MAKSRLITRTYYSKKQGKYITKTYTYEASKHKSTRGSALVSKSGKINKKNVSKLKDEINNNADFSKAEKRALNIELDALVRQRAQDGKKLTSSGFWGSQAETDVDRFFSNLGRDIEEVAKELGVTVDELRDESNWDKKTHTFIKPSKTPLSDYEYDYSGYEYDYSDYEDDYEVETPVKYQFNFTYTGNIWRQV